MRLATHMARLVSAAACALLAGASPASAVQDIVSCDSTQAGNTTTCTTNCRLLANITCSGANPNTPGITLTKGADLDLNGFSIIFTGANNLKSAVTAGANSIIKDNDDDPGVEGAILGSYAGTTPAIKCTSATGTKVTGVRVDVSQGTGVLRCGTVEDSVIISATTAAGDAVSTAGTVSNNYIGGFAGGVNAAPGTVDNNLVQTLNGQRHGIHATHGSSLTGNVVLGPATDLIDASGTVSFEDNYCDLGQSNCTACVSSGFCEDDPVAPFMFP